MAPQAVELCDFHTLMENLRLVSPSSLRPALAPPVADLRHDLSRDGARRVLSIQDEEEAEADQHATIAAGKQCTHGGDESQQLLPSSSSSSTAALLPHPSSTSYPATTGTAVASASTSAATSNRQIMRCMCSSALILFSVTALLLLLPVVLPPLPPPPSELMLLPVAILLLLVCAALTPRPTALPSSAASSNPSQPIALLPLPHSLPLRSSMQL